MRLLSLKRLCYWLSRTGYTRINYWVALHASGTFVVTKDFETWVFKLYRNLTCLRLTGDRPLALLRNMYEQVADDVWCVQGSIVSHKGNPDLGRKLTSGIPCVSLEDNIPVDPAPVKHSPTGRGAFDAALDPEDEHILSDWVHSGDVLDPELQIKALKGYTAIDDSEVDLDEVWELVIAQLWLSDEEPEYAEALTKEGLYKLPINRNSSGVLPLDPLDGKVCGSKEEMIDPAVTLAMDYTLLSPMTVSAKPEVIKVGKKVRWIVMEAMHLFLLCAFFFHSFVRRHGCVVDADCRGLSSMQGGSLKPWLHMILGLQHIGSKSFGAALDQLADLGLSESDKKGWDVSLNKNSAFAFVIVMHYLVRPSPVDVYRFANLMAHQLVPYVQLHGSLCVPIYGKVASGCFFTAYRNTKTHAAGFQRVLMAVQEHDDQLCPGCKYCGVVPQLTEEELKIVSHYNVMGDDFLGPNIAADRKSVV